MHSRGSPARGTQSEVDTSPLPVGGPTRGRNCYVTTAFSAVPNKGSRITTGYLAPLFWGPTRGQNCYVTPAFSGIPNKGYKITRGYLTAAFLGAHRRAKLLHNPYIASPRNVAHVFNHSLLFEPLFPPIPSHSLESNHNFPSHIAALNHCNQLETLDTGLETYTLDTNNPLVAILLLGLSLQ